MRALGDKDLQIHFAGRNRRKIRFHSTRLGVDVPQVAKPIMYVPVSDSLGNETSHDLEKRGFSLRSGPMIEVIWLMRKSSSHSGIFCYH